MADLRRGRRQGILTTENTKGTEGGNRIRTHGHDARAPLEERERAIASGKKLPRGVAGGGWMREELTLAVDAAAAQGEDEQGAEAEQREHGGLGNGRDGVKHEGDVVGIVGDAEVVAEVSAGERVV